MDDDENTTELVDEAADEAERHRMRGNHFVGFKMLVVVSEFDRNEIRLLLLL